MSAAPPDPLVRRHLRWGWSALLLFLSLGIVMEAFHGLKVDWFLNVENETRRLLWRLAHSHGTLLGLVHLAFAATLEREALVSAPGARLASALLVAATVLLPGGFWLGGWTIHAGDPGRGIVLVPVGALALVLAVAWTALRVLRLR